MCSISKWVKNGLLNNADKYLTTVRLFKMYVSIPEWEINMHQLRLDRLVKQRIYSTKIDI